MIVAVTGATGYVGRFVVAALQARGDRVRALVRPGRENLRLAEEIELVTGDLDDPPSDLCAGADALVHAALDHLPGRYRGGEGDDPQRYLDINLMGSLRLLRQARAMGVRRCVLLSSRAVYGRRVPGIPLDETHPAWPDTLYGATKVALEAFAAALGQGQGWEIGVLRPTGVYGITHPVERSKWYDLVRTTLAGEVWPGRRGGSEVHGADVARAVLLLLGTSDLAGRVFNCADLYLTDRDIASTVQRLAGVDGPLPEAPRAPPRDLMVCRALAELRFRFGGRPLLERTLAELIEAVRRAQ